MLLGDSSMAYGLIRDMFDDNWVTRDELFATGAAFTVVAWGFAYPHQVVQIVRPGSFIASVDPTAARSWMELLFLSFTTLTSTGLSDVMPIAPHARPFVMIEQVAGMMYLALVMARIVGLMRLGSRSRTRTHRPYPAGMPSSSAIVASDGPRCAPRSRATASTSRMTRRVLPPPRA